MPPAESKTSADTVETERLTIPDINSRTTSQLWIEVIAILCLAYIPYLFYSISATIHAPSTPHSFVDDMLYWIVSAFQMSMPLLVIVALTKDPWSRFGIVRPRWIVDILAGCAIYVCDLVLCNCVRVFLPASMLKISASVPVADRTGPEGIPTYFLLLFACIATGFAQEFGLYLSILKTDLL